MNENGSVFRHITAEIPLKDYEMAKKYGIRNRDAVRRGFKVMIQEATKKEESGAGRKTYAPDQQEQVRCPQQLL
jgi:hypothetical protein